MFWSAEVVNKASTTDDSEFKPLMFHQPCQQNSNLQRPRIGTNDCLLLLQISSLKYQLPWASQSYKLGEASDAAQ